MKTVGTLVLVSLVLVGCSTVRTSPDTAVADAKSNIHVLPISNVKWEQLNPARGDKSPQAGTLWGNRKASGSTDAEYNTPCPICELGKRKGSVPTGFLAKFVDGFSSPPHIHNVTYRAVVIIGLVHNDDPNATPMWMPSGSFWTQPKGEVHITAAKGDKVMALVEIDKGPYLVLPPAKAFDSGERPVNVDLSNIVWVDPPGMSGSVEGPKVAYLWGNLKDGESNGTFLKLPPGFAGTLYSQGRAFRAVVIRGHLEYHSPETKALEPGSHFGSSEDSVHNLACRPDKECTIYIRTNGKYRLTHRQE